MKERLKSCDRWHPGSPAEFSIYKRKNRNGTTYDQIWCRVCGRARCKSYHVLNAKSVKAYGVIRLSWPAPEALLPNGGSTHG